MQAEKRWHILFSIIILLITSSQCMNSYEGKQKEERTLLDVILHVIGDNQRDKVASRRITSGLYFVSQDVKFSSREKSPAFPKQDASRPIEIIPRDVNIKDKFIKHFTGPVKFSTECRSRFQRLYHNTRDCGTPACTYTHFSLLQKMRKIVDKISNESTVCAALGTTCPDVTQD